MLQQHPRQQHKFPTDDFESFYWRRGHRYVVGLDEVGRGCLAGPVVAGCVAFTQESIPEGLQDSKKLTSKKREFLDGCIREKAIAYALGIASVDEIDRFNILRATQLAMKRALFSLKIVPDVLLIDGIMKLDVSLPQRYIVGGDQKSVSIAAASILAKVYRDRWMAQMDSFFDGFSFASHKGYGSVFHRQKLSEKGQTHLHRKTFSWTEV